MRHKEFINIFRELSPTEVFNILTRSKYPEILDEDSSNWDYRYQFKSTNLSISINGVMIYNLTRERSKEIELEIKEFNLFEAVWSKWDIESLIDSGYSVGFYYSRENFYSLYKEYIRNKKILNILS